MTRKARRRWLVVEVPHVRRGRMRAYAVRVASWPEWQTVSVHADPDDAYSATCDLCPKSGRDGTQCSHAYAVRRHLANEARSLARPIPRVHTVR